MPPRPDSSEPDALAEPACAQPRLYGDLAAWWPLMSPPQDYAAEAQAILRMIDRRLGAKPSAAARRTLLELGAGGGHTLVHLADAYDVTATDLSAAMLANCQTLVPTARCIVGDMRSLRLQQIFDIVIVHDAIDYMVCPADLKAALATAAAHLRPAGLFIVAPTYIRETFADHEAASDQQADGDRELRYTSHVREQPQHRDADGSGVIELSLLMMLRDQGMLDIACDRHTCGLFAEAQWRAWLADAGFEDIELWEGDAAPFQPFIATRMSRHGGNDPCPK